MTKAYLSGPMAIFADSHWGHPIFDSADAELSARFDVVNPAELSRQMCAERNCTTGDISRADYMAVDIAELCKCDAIVMLPRWRESSGARAEFCVALSIGLKIYYSVDEALADVELAA